MRVLGLILLVQLAFGEELFLPENPSNLYNQQGEIVGLQDQVGKAIITTKEIEEKRAEEGRLAELNEIKRKKEEARLARIAKRKSGEIEPPVDCVGYSGEKSHTIVSGDTLGKVALKIYGNSAYSTLISVYNSKPANKLFIGEELKTPSPYEIFVNSEGETTWQKYPYAIRDLLRVHEQIKTMQPSIIEEKRAGKYSDDTKAQLDEMLWILSQVKQDFLDKVEGIDEYPSATLSQLQSVINNVKEIRRGNLGKGNRNFQRVSLYMINCYSYAMAWGRGGFKTPKD